MGVTKMLISIGNNRYDEQLITKEYQWEELIKKFNNPVVTTETYLEYLKMTKQQKAAVKDKGFFIGGKLSRNIRKKNNIIYRSLLTIDIDNCNEGIYKKIDRVMRMYSFKGCCYSTHTHNNKEPRLRLILPFENQKGPRTGDEYSYICRVISKLIGMDSIDRTTFQPTRIMYWPSKSRDGDFYFKEWDGKIYLSKGMILKPGWEDITTWPKHPFEEKVRGNSEKQEDPCDKKGAIGAFCRAFTISEVLSDDRFLNGIYAATNQDDRWTFLGGSTFGGAMVYEDKYLYSWHATDPAGGRLSNAYDLLRIHKFNGDEKATIKFITKISEVSKELAAEEFGDNYKEWQNDLIRNDKGVITSLYKNIELIVKNEFKLTYDLFDRKYYMDNKGKWFKSTDYLEDQDIGQMHKWIEMEYGMHTTIQKIENTMRCTGNDNSYHPIKDYLESLKWDGKQRVDKLLTEVFGVEDTKYHRTIIRMTLLAAVTRIYEPGIKFDTVLTFVGPEDIGKSSFARILFKEKWFSDSLTLVQMKDKTGSELTAGAWGIELAELAGKSKAEVEIVKGFITRQEDRYRPSYGRVVENRKRECIFFATSNGEDGFLTDITGNRRWLIVQVEKNVNQTKLESEVDQIWAEVLQIYKHKKEPLYITDAKVKEEALRLQREYLVVDDNLDYIRTYLDMEVPATWSKLDLHEKRSYIKDYMSEGNTIGNDGIIRSQISIAEIWTELFGRELTEKTRSASEGIKANIIRLGFKRGKSVKTIKNCGRQRMFDRI